MENIRRLFTESIVTPLEILRALIPRVEEDFSIEPITIKQTIKIIDSLKNSNSTGHDDINNRLLKKCKYRIAPHLTHLINTILSTKKFPRIFKISRILPLSKPGMDRLSINSYRPINNLCSIEKIIEAHLLLHLENFFDRNKILVENHHGGRRNHSTVTAIASIYHILYKNDERSIISVILTTDLSAAYDTVDVSILLDKLSHYGIRGGWLKLFSSYFNDRKQYVRLENMPSILRNSPNCSIVQGSKLSGFMYNTYCNELPILHRLINSEIYYKLVDNDSLRTNNVSHEVRNFVDNSTSILGFKDHNKIRIYLEKYYKLLQGYIADATLTKI